MSSATLQAPPDQTSRLFRELADRWKEQTRYLSSASEKSMHPDYQRIIGMGSDAIPLILEEMNRQPGQWFWALSSITGENPVPDEDRGRIAAMTEQWLQWGRLHGYIS